LFHIHLEFSLQPYLINVFQKINLKRLKTYYYYRIINHIIRRNPIALATRLGFSIAIKAIEEEWKPNEIRRIIKRIVEEYRNSFNLNRV